jgi:glyoxylate reductase
MPLPHIYITRQLAPQALDILRPHAQLNIFPEDRPVPRNTLLAQAAHADALICLLTDRIDEELLNAAPKLKVISQVAVGYDNIDIPACTAHKIPVGNTPGVLTETTADLAFALLLAAARRITEAEHYLRSGNWQTWSPNLLVGVDVHHATIGLIGAGRIGAEVARRAAGFQMRILYHNRNRSPELENQFAAQYRSMDELLAESDFVSIHCPLNENTKHLIGAPQFAKMKPTAILINTARGPVVDQKALYHALRHKTIAAAGLDVFETEPLPMDDPLLTLTNVVLVPHIGSASIATRTNMALLAAHNCLAGIRGEPLPHCVNPEVYTTP